MAVTPIGNLAQEQELASEPRPWQKEGVWRTCRRRPVERGVWRKTTWNQLLSGAVKVMPAVKHEIQPDGPKSIDAEGRTVRRTCGSTPPAQRAEQQHAQGRKVGDLEHSSREDCLHADESQLKAGPSGRSSRGRTLTPSRRHSQTTNEAIGTSARTIGMIKWRDAHPTAVPLKRAVTGR
jgi:hypothetical protein